MRRFRVPEIALGFGLGIIAFLFVASVASYQTEHCGQQQHSGAEKPSSDKPVNAPNNSSNRDQEPPNYNQRHPIACGIVGFFPAMIAYMDENEGFFVGAFTGLLFMATVLLWRATNALWDAGERQIRVMGGSARRQFQAMSDANVSTRVLADAAERSANAAIRTERPYVFIKTIGPNLGDALKRGWGPSIQCTIRNSGRTPAIIETYSVQFWQTRDSPIMRAAPAQVLPVVLAEGETHSFDVVWSVVWPESSTTFAELRNGTKNIWFHFSFGYQDVLGTGPHETAGRWRYRFSNGTWDGGYETAT